MLQDLFSIIQFSFSDSLGCACQLEETQDHDSHHYHGAQNKGKGIDKFDKV